MSLTLGNVGQILADGESDAGSMPISSETQDNIISALSVASSLLLFTIIGVSGECCLGDLFCWVCEALFVDPLLQHLFS